MTTYAEVQGSTLIKYPYSFADLQAENPFTNYGSDTDFVSIFPGTDTAVKNGYTLVPVTIATQPTFDPATQVCTPNTQPTLVNGVWTLGWTVTTLSSAAQAVLAAQSRQAAYATALASGITITSTSTPSLNGVYNVAPANQDAISAVMTGVANGLGLPGGQATFEYLDASNTPHAFTSDQFKTFATAVRDYVYALALYAAGQGTLPSPSITIP